MDIRETVFRNKKVDESKLEAYGFTARDGGYYLSRPICDGQLNLKLTVEKGDLPAAKVLDGDDGDEYTLHLVDGAEGEFVGKVRAEYERALKDFAEKCCEDLNFRFRQTEAVAAYAKQKYADELEFLWKNTPDCAVLRRKDNNKWYAVIMTVGGDKFGHNPERDEVIDVRALPEKIDNIADGKNYFRGYHMNKKHWLTVCLDGSVPTEEIFALLDDSYLLAAKK